MPPDYARAFDAADAEEHARIVAGRGDELARVVVWRELEDAAAILCVVTDDRPGLVACVTSAFLAHALDVRAAQIYCRARAQGGFEAVDFFWVQGVAPAEPLEAGSVLEACARTIRELIAADARAEHEPVSLDGVAPQLAYQPEQGLPGAFAVTLETCDFPGLLHLVARS